MYQYREVMLGSTKNQKGILVIEFDDPKMKIVGEFLMADGAMLGKAVLDEMNQVLQGETNEVKISGNRCGLHITKETTVINDLLTDLYEDVSGLPTYEIETETLKDIWKDWLETRKAYYGE